MSDDSFQMLIADLRQGRCASHATIAERLQALLGSSFPEPSSATGPDEDGRCTGCGLEWPDEKETLEPHRCPPGFLQTPDRTLTTRRHSSSDLNHLILDRFEQYRRATAERDASIAALEPLFWMLAGEAMAPGTVIADYLAHRGSLTRGNLRESRRVRVDKCWVRIEPEQPLRSKLVCKCTPLRRHGSELAGEATIEFPIFDDPLAASEAELIASAIRIWSRMKAAEKGC